MRVLMVTHYFGSHGGGVEIVAEELYRQLAARGQEIVWIAGDTTPEPSSIGISCAASVRTTNFVEERIGLPFPIPTPGALRKINAEIRKADLLILHDCLYLSNIAAFFMARLRGINTMVVQHIGFVPYRNPLLRAIMRFSNVVITRPMLSRADQVVFISKTTQSFFSTVDFQRQPQVIFNGVNTDLYHLRGERESKPDLRRKYDLPPESPVILFVGRFVEKKGIHVLRRMSALRPDSTWVFVGWGPLDPSRWNAPNVRVFSGLRGEAVAALYRACDVFVLPSTGEGFPLVLQEALASGLPIICGTETLAADPELSRFVRGVPVYADDDDRTAREFLQAIEAILTSSDGKEKCEHRRAFAISRYSWDSAVQRYLEIASSLGEEETHQPAAVGASEKLP